MESSAASTITNGVVEVFEPGEIRGWLDVQSDSDPLRVRLCVNGEEIVSGWALASDTLQGQGQIRQFRLALNDVWLFVRKSDSLTVQVDDTPLPIVGHGTVYKPTKDGKKSLADLRDQKEKGFVFGQTGKLQLSKTVDKNWQDDVLGLFHRVNIVLEEKFGYSAFFCYGTLLGAVRENGFIGHDLDFDSAYISNKRTGAEAKQELQRISFALIEAGFNITAKWSCIVISDETGKTKLDLFHLYYDSTGQIAFPFGVAGNSNFTSEDFGKIMKIDFLGNIGHVPEHSEKFVEHVYGKTWRTPNPGFNWDRDRATRAKEGIFQAHQVEEIYWANFYAHASYDTQSTFCDYVLARSDIPSVILDIGCGDGRDSYAFAKTGRQVVGLDRSHIAVRHANDKFSQLPSGENVHFEVCDAGDAGAVGEAIMKSREENDDRIMMFYARFFLHSIPEATQATLLSTLRDGAKQGDLFAAEFRIDKDQDARKVHGKHYRRFQNGAAFLEKLRKDYGFDILVEQEGNGFSPYKGEDPYLLRVLARRGGQ